jgi:acyl-[acyl-carrier-protein]-phospholipid O-acyltransferase/long-chain-fatty-acid--[acyl-carrier-protein] ligase
MAGYLLASDPGVLQPPADGWHDTGDIVALDDAGFISIKGRAKRFAKIGGEMVSLPAVEGYAAQCWPGHAHAIVTRPDRRRARRWCSTPPVLPPIPRCWHGAARMA